LEKGRGEEAFPHDKEEGGRGERKKDGAGKEGRYRIKGGRQATVTGGEKRKDDML